MGDCELQIVRDELVHFTGVERAYLGSGLSH